jgi:transposase-like protein
MNNENETAGETEGQPMPKTEVVSKPKRKQFSAAERLRILREVEACQGSGEIGALLRREGIYSSYLTTWRRQKERGELDGLSPQKRGPKTDPQAIELAKLRRENERLQKKLQQAELIIDIHTCPGGRCQGKKVSQILGIPLAEVPPEEEA